MIQLSTPFAFVTAPASCRTMIFLAWRMILTHDSMLPAAFCKEMVPVKASLSLLLLPLSPYMNNLPYTSRHVFFVTPTMEQKYQTFFPPVDQERLHN